MAAAATAAAAVKTRNDIWTQLYQEKRRLLEQECNGTVPSLNFDGFKTALTELCNKYSATGLVRLVASLQPHLDHVRSFTSAISSAAQANTISTLVWAGLQVFIEVACRFSNHLANIIHFIDEFHSELPLLDLYVTLFPNRPELQFPLRDMYVAYIDYCLAAVKQLKKRKCFAFLKFGFSSSQQDILAKATRAIQKHRDEFFRQIDYVDRARVHNEQKQQAIAINALGIPSIALKPFNHSPASSSRSNVTWPIHSAEVPVDFSFYGRRDILKVIEETFFPPGHAALPPSPAAKPAKGPACCILHGLGGIGKTSIARQYIVENSEKYDAIFWLRADPATELSNGFFVQIARKLRLVDEDCTPALAVEDAKDWLEDTGRPFSVKSFFDVSSLTAADRKWLLVFDNVNQFSDVLPYLPRKSGKGGHVVITSQNAPFIQLTDGPCKEILLDGFEAEHGADALFKYLRRQHKSNEEYEVAKEISRAVGGLPLAIATIAGYVGPSSSELKEFLESFNRSSRFWTTDQNVTLGKYERTLGTVFEIALGNLTPEPLALLKVIVFLNPDGVPEPLLRHDHPPHELPFLAKEDGLGFMDVIMRLQQRHLVTRKTIDGVNCLSLHRSLQWTVLHRLNKDPVERHSQFYLAFNLIRRIVPVLDPLVIPEPEKWPIYQRYLPQVLSLVSTSQEPLPALGESLDFANLLNDMSSYMWYQGHIAECQRTADMAETILDKLNFDQFSKIRWDLHIIHGIICSFTGISKRAEGLQRRLSGLAICDHQEVGVKDPTEDMLTMRCISQADLAFAYLEDEDLDKVEDMMQTCALLYSKLGDDQDLPFHWARFHHHRAYGTAAKGDRIEALRMCERAARLEESHSGVDSTYTQDYRFSIAEMLYHAGDLQQALTLNENVLEARRRLDGEFNHRTLTSYFIVGILHWRLGKLDKAEEHMGKCLQKERNAHWSEEKRARASFYFSKFLHAKGQSDKAREYAATAAAIKMRLQNEHPRHLREDPKDERVAYDLMVSIWDLRLTGRVHGPSDPWW